MSLFEDTVAKWTATFQKELEIKGFQADAIWGNGGHESGGLKYLQEIKPLVAGSRGGGGIWQWTGPRRRDFEAWCAANGLDPNSLDASCRYLIHDLKTDYASVLQALRETRTRDEATQLLMARYEIPAAYQNRHDDPDGYQRNLNNRIAWAVRAEAARLAEEGKAMTDTSVADVGRKAVEEALQPPQTGLGGPSPYSPPKPTVAPVAPASDLAAAIRRFEPQLLDFIAAQLVSHGVPAFAVQMGRSMLQHVDVAELVAAGIRHVDPEAVALALLNMLAKRMSAA